MRFDVLVLGSSAALPTAERFCSGQLVCTETSRILVDCGEGTQIQLQRSGEGFGGLDIILISHLHGDHYFGLPGLLTSMVLNERQRPLTIISPPGLQSRLLPILEWDKYSWPFDLEFIELSPAVLNVETLIEQPLLVYSLRDVEILAFPLKHRLPTAGYLIREKARLPNLRKDQIEKYQIPYQFLAGIKAGSDFRRSVLNPSGEVRNENESEAETEVIPHADLVSPAVPPRAFAYCSDTRYFPEVARFVEGVDLLYHEATFLHELLDRAEATNHSTAQEAAQIALSAAVKRLLIGHFSSRYPSAVPLLTEARQIFPATDIAKELERHVIPAIARPSEPE